MNYNEFIKDLRAKLTDNNSGIVNQFVHGWLSEINDSFNDYDCLLMFPAKNPIPNLRDKRWSKYNITWYLFTQNIDQSTRKQLTKDQIDEAWSDLLIKLESFMDKLTEDPNIYRIEELTNELDEGHIGTDDLIWVKSTFNLFVAKC